MTPEWSLPLSNQQEALTLNLEQAAAFIGVTPAQLYSRTRTRARKRDRHPVPAFRLGSKTIAFCKADLAAWVEQRKRDGAL